MCSIAWTPYPIVVWGAPTSAGTSTFIMWNWCFPTWHTCTTANVAHSSSTPFHSLIFLPPSFLTSSVLSFLSESKMDSHLSPFSFLNISSSSVRLFPASSSLLAEIDRTQLSRYYILSIFSVYSQYILSIFSVVYSQYMYIPSVYSWYICSILSVYYRVPMLNTNQS